MPDSEETADEIERGAGRLFRRSLLLLLSLGVIGAWAGHSGWYRLQPGEAGVVLQLGRYARTETQTGLHFKLPPTIGLRTILGAAVPHRQQLIDVA